MLRPVAGKDGGAAATTRGSVLHYKVGLHRNVVESEAESIRQFRSNLKFTTVLSEMFHRRYGAKRIERTFMSRYFILSGEQIIRAFCTAVNSRAQILKECSSTFCLPVVFEHKFFPEPFT